MLDNSEPDKVSKINIKIILKLIAPLKYIYRKISTRFTKNLFSIQESLRSSKKRLYESNK
jgi:hypothetical protein